MTMMPVEERTQQKITNWVEKADEKFGFFLSDVQAVVHNNAANFVAALRIFGEKHQVALHVQAIRFSPCSTMPLRRIPI